ncbi:ileal sodium/bile acid cotransporter-like, partial [Saccoglossus kowalevskii]|uniref:Ileal sodium/bile acid cotransporter-like n=1 Tax=Saccoglossus kowalevskii TaxID=10224 RepID=A0ABM0MWK0_SACKO
ILSVFVILGILLFIVLTFFTSPHVFKSSWQPYMVSFLYPLFAFALGYTIPILLKFNSAQARTVAFETGIQNSALALSIINLLIIQGNDVKEMMIVPTLHAVMTVIESFTIVGIYWAYKKLKAKQQLQSVCVDDEKGETKSIQHSQHELNKVSGIENISMVTGDEKSTNTGE